MDNRTGIRQTRTKLRGPAARAAQARRALGAREEAIFHAVRDVPAPLVHGALGFAACALATLLRPQIAGTLPSAAGTSLLAVIVGAVILIYDRTAILSRKAPIESVAVPVAAVASYVALLGQIEVFAVRAVAASIAAFAIALIPQLEARELSTLRATWWFAAARDALSIAVLIPAIAVGVSSDQPPVLRIGFTLGVTFLVSVEVLRTTTGASRRSWLLWGLALAVLTMAAGFLAEGSGVQVGTGGVLLFWYGMRGFADAYLAGRTGMLLILEYLGVVGLAALLLLIARGS